MTGDILPLLSSAFLIGLLGSAHCIGMCGGISASLSMALPVGSGYRWRQLSLLISYNIGRIFSYTLIALVLAGISQLAVKRWTGLALPLRTIAGLLLVAMGLSLGRWWQGIVAIERVGKPFWKRIAPLSHRLVPVHHGWQALLLGVLWGWLPCGLVYSTLAWAIAQAGQQQAALIMIFFGLGTLPSMLLTGLAARRVERLRQHLALRRFAGVALVLYGLWTIPPVHFFVMRLIDL